MDSATASACTGAAHAAVYSIRNHFAPGSAVLLTGASGYIGSLVLEKLLRSTDVGHVYLLMRGRRGTSPADRLARLLQGPLFHLIDPAQVADRVSVVAGDILEPGLGLSPADEAVLLERVDTVIHSAAGARGSWLHPLCCKACGLARSRHMQQSTKREHKHHQPLCKPCQA